MVLNNSREKEHSGMFDQQYQAYDSALKALFGNEVAEVSSGLERS